jgi:hypothetical protein
MGRRPIHEEAMSAAERQRRRRARVRAEPWRDQRLAGRAILQALREMQGDGEQVGQLGPELLAQIVGHAVANMGLEDEAELTEAREILPKLLDPNEPLPERAHRGTRGHRPGDGRRRRHGRRNEETDKE